MALALVGLLALPPALASEAQPARAATPQAGVARLGDILALALRTDAQYAAARAATQAARERLPQAQAALRPNVNATFNNRRNADGGSGFSDTRRYDTQTAALTLTQPLFRPAGVAGVEQAELQLQLAERQLALAEQDLLLRVARGYFDVLQAQDELAAATAQREALTQQLAQARRSLEVGTVPITDVSEAQARNDLARAQEIAVRNELENRKRVLERSIGQPLPPLARMDPDVDPPVAQPDLQDQLVDAAPRNAIPVSIARLAVEVSTIEIRRRNLGHAPTLDLVWSVRRDLGVNPTAFGTSDTRQSSIGLEMNIPLYQGGVVGAREREAAADLLRAQSELTNAARQAELDARQAQLGVQSGEALTRALRQALASSESQLRSTQRGLQVGVRTRVDVLNAEQQLFVTRRDLAAARYRTLVATLQLRASAGALEQGDLRALDALLTR